MADHLITGTLTYVIVVCGNLACQKTWEQPNTPLEDAGWNVCPECLWSAPTNVARALRETEQCVISPGAGAGWYRCETHDLDFMSQAEFRAHADGCGASPRTEAT